MKYIDDSKLPDDVRGATMKWLRENVNVEDHVGTVNDKLYRISLCSIFDDDGENGTFGEFVSKITEAVSNLKNPNEICFETEIYFDDYDIRFYENWERPETIEEAEKRIQKEIKQYVKNRDKEKQEREEYERLKAKFENNQ